MIAGWEWGGRFDGREFCDICDAERDEENVEGLWFWALRATVSEALAYAAAVGVLLFLLLLVVWVRKGSTVWADAIP